MHSELIIINYGKKKKKTFIHQGHIKLIKRDVLTFYSSKNPEE